MSETITHPALRYHGAKFRLAPWIQQFFPPHHTYVEPFGGAAGVLLQKPPAPVDVYNDLDGDVVNFFRVLRDRAMRSELIAAIQLTPYARDEFDLAYEEAVDPVERARRLCARAYMGFGSAGATKATTGFRTDARQKSSLAQHDWTAYPSALAAAGQRFSGVLVENRDAIAVMREHDGPDTLFFVDPPYVHDTRDHRNCRNYRHEMTDADHRRLLSALRSVDGMAVVCGYPSELYDAELAAWQRYETSARISSHRGSANRTEVVWINPACSAAIERGRLFSWVAA